MADYLYRIADALTGEWLGEAPLTGVTYSELVSGVGTLTARLPVSHPAATPALLRPGRRDLTVYRDSVPVWHGPIVEVSAALHSEVIITARGFLWTLSKRVVDVDRRYNRDVYAIVRDLVTIGTTGKGASGVLPRFAVEQLDRGVVKRFDVFGRERRYVLDTIDDLAGDARDGFDYALRIEESGDASGMIERTLLLRDPLGSPQTGYALAEAAGSDWNITVTESLDRAATRVDVVGSSQVVRVETPAALLLEEVLRRNDLRSADVMAGLGRDALRLLVPPVRSYTASFRPCAAMPYAVVGLGDTVLLYEQDGYLDVNAIVRVTGRSVTVDEQGDERIDLVFESPADVILEGS